VFDHVERRRVLEQPAGKHFAPRQPILRAGAFFDKDLDECAGFLRVFPWSGALACRQLDDHIAHPARFARFHNDVLRDVVALVDQADRGDAVLYRGAKIVFIDAAGQCRWACRLGRFGWRRRLCPPITPRQRQNETRGDGDQRDRNLAFHRMGGRMRARQGWSGDQAS